MPNAILRFLGNAYGFYLVFFKTFTLKRENGLTSYIFFASIDVLQSYFAHTFLRCFVANSLLL